MPPNAQRAAFRPFPAPQSLFQKTRRGHPKPKPARPDVRAYGFAAWQSPGFQPAELLWRNSKGFAGQEYRTKRDIKGVYSDLCDYWYGTAKSAKRGKQIDPFGGTKAASLVTKCQAEMNEWIKKFGVRCTGRVGVTTGGHAFKYNAAKDYGGEVDDADSELAADMAADDDWLDG